MVQRRRDLDGCLLAHLGTAELEDKERSSTSIWKRSYPPTPGAGGVGEVEMQQRSGSKSNYCIYFPGGAA
ncbi:hypothetical protein VPH35_090813 [Triticum aestivum]